MASGTWETVKALGTMPAKLYHVGRASLGLEKRDQNGPMSVVGAGRVAGEISSRAGPGRRPVLQAAAAARRAEPVPGMFNLVPLPPLDGGPIAGDPLRGRPPRDRPAAAPPDPGYVDSAKLLPVTYAMAAVILLASVVLIYADIVAPVSLS